MKKKPSISKVTILENGLFSVHTHRNYRTLITMYDDKEMCSHKDCVERTELQNQNSQECDTQSCQHIRYLSSEEHNQPINSWSIETIK